MLTSVQEDTVLHSRFHDSIVSSREMNVTGLFTPWYVTPIAKGQVRARVTLIPTSRLRGSKVGHFGTKAK